MTSAASLSYPVLLFSIFFFILQYFFVSLFLHFIGILLFRLSIPFLLSLRLSGVFRSFIVSLVFISLFRLSCHVRPPFYCCCLVFLSIQFLITCLSAVYFILSFMVSFVRSFSSRCSLSFRIFYVLHGFC